MIGSVPQDRVKPPDVPGLCTLLAQCDRDGSAVLVQGADTLRGMGFPPRRADVILAMTGLDRIVAHEAADLTCAVQAGVTLASLAERLAERGQFVPIDAPRRRAATLGGTLAAGWLGPRRHLYGRPRDFVIGSHAVLADGTLAHAGGMVVKNVTGYDMSKLYIGSFGTLAVLAQLNLKTIPQPASARVILAKLPERTRSRTIAAVHALPVVPAVFLCVEGFRKAVDGEDGVDGRIFMLFEGSQALVDRATRDVRSALGKAGVPEATIVDTGARESFDRALDATIANVAERSVTYRSLGTPATAEPRALAMRDLANRHELFTDVLIDPLNGDVFVRVSERDTRAFASRIETFDDAVHEAEPRAVVVAGDAPMRGSLRVWGEEPAALVKMRAIKARFDPHGTLNPGRYVAGI
ncbi:MAG TPA: FAD-binding oxidoreductase [Candidatus Baltobacteraceae bacterium]|jgi:glycolate oxidase FAD binding subunit